MRFHPLKSGRNPTPSTLSALLPSFHPLKSGRNAVAPPELQFVPSVSIPSSRVGTLEHGAGNNSLPEFPSPQVGSEPAFAAFRIALVELFPSPQVGSELAMEQIPNEVVAEVSIPSSRVGTLNFRNVVATLPSFPSPQVGSERLRFSSFVSVSNCFHPLKSGRNPPKTLGLTLQGHVSIPSSRVGTAHVTKRHGAMALFPSPQVGSEPRWRWWDGHGEGGFPSPQVGSERVRSGGRCEGIESFHPLKSGRNQDKDAIVELMDKSFHPLKSGRNTANPQVCFRCRLKFPSPQVGSEQAAGHRACRQF